MAHSHHSSTILLVICTIVFYSFPPAVQAQTGNEIELRGTWSPLQFPSDLQSPMACLRELMRGGTVDGACVADSSGCVAPDAKGNRICASLSVFEADDDSDLLECHPVELSLRAESAADQFYFLEGKGSLCKSTSRLGNVIFANFACTAQSRTGVAELCVPAQLLGGLLATEETTVLFVPSPQPASYWPAYLDPYLPAD